ncbi:MAG: P-loop NTPase [Thaumarchaeota archaeon]|jgi:ATP-binding protein involved in chromosome partitioning|nr:P-loop NTPase [Candidatus Geocrenenecus arthurdayi]
MLDPRISLLRKKLENVKSIVLFGSGKGGVGKSVISSATSYILSERGYDVAYLDLDFHGPAGQSLFPVDIQFKGGREGVELPISDGVRVMSIGYFLGDNPFPLAGREKIDLLIDFFSILNIGKLDSIIIDLPPGMGDELTFTQRVFRDRVSIVAVTMDSELSLNVAEKLMKYIKTEKINFLGIIVNMVNLFREYNPKQIEKRLRGEVLGAVSYHPRLEEFKTIKSKLENVHEFRREIEHVVDDLLKRVNLLK